MFVYEKKLQFPVKIKNPNPKIAKFIASQYGGPHGELGASLRYLSQRFSMPYEELKATLTDVGNEELSHLEMVGTILYQLTRNLSEDDVKANIIQEKIRGQSAAGTPTSAWSIASTGDTLADLNEDLAAEQKARLTYDNILRLVDDPDVREPIKFLRERELVHYQRFGECIRLAQDRLNCKNFYAINPSFDK